MYIPGSTLIQSDTEAKASGKRKGGGLDLYVNKRWCNPVKEKMCCPDITFLKDNFTFYTCFMSIFLKFR